ncbi:MAG: pyruvate:ferredoxin (flavodoxin) oxidoreductase, partial [Microthrixaceae bacterium]
PPQRFTIGINDDVTGLSLPVEADRFSEREDVTTAILVGLGSDGTVGAAKNACKIAADRPGGAVHVQGYFVYDSKKSGAVTISHLRFADERLNAPWLIDRADYVGIHQFSLLERHDLFGRATDGATVVLNSPHGPAGTWQRLPGDARRHIVERDLRVHVIDASSVSREAGLGGIVSTVMLTCFVNLAALAGDASDTAAASRAIKSRIEADYGKLGESVLRPNRAAVDATLEHLRALEVPTSTTVPEDTDRVQLVTADAPDFVAEVTAEMMAGRGDSLPVSVFPPDGTYPPGTTRWEKRGIAFEVPSWEPELCIDCGKCAAICPHAAVRTKAYEPDLLHDAPAAMQSKEAKFFEGHRLTVQVFPDDCTGCGLCVEICPARSRSELKTKALNMVDRAGVLDAQRVSSEYFGTLPDAPPEAADPLTTRGVQLREPLFEFSGACSGCGETPYLKLLTQVAGDHMVVANATGCSSIYGANLPTTPWKSDQQGRGPAWSNSLFEDNAEFGLGIRLALDQRAETAKRLTAELGAVIGDELVSMLAGAPQTSDAERAAQRERVAELRRRLDGHDDPRAATLSSLADDLVDTEVWIVGGDGWAYDIGFGGLDHVLASGHDINVLVMDTEGYSNTGGQASKATFRAAVAKFASGGKEQRKKDLGMLAAGYGNVYVAQVAIGSNDLQATRAITEAQSYEGPSLVLAYSHCIAHGIDMTKGAEHQKMAVKSGYWPLWRYDPRHAHRGDHPLRLDSRAPSVSFAEFARSQARFSLLERTNPKAAERLFALAQHDIDERWNLYEQMGEMERWADDEVTP